MGRVGPDGHQIHPVAEALEDKGHPRYWPVEHKWSPKYAFLRVGRERGLMGVAVDVERTLWSSREQGRRWGRDKGARSFVEP